MTGRAKGLKGIWTACLSFVLLYAVYLGCSAVAVLTTALDAHGSVDPLLTGRLGWLFMLVSQGVGVTFSGVLIGVPALLTMLLDVSLIASIAKRHGPTLGASVLGLITWCALCVLATWRSGLHTSDNLAIVGVKAAAIFAVGYVLASMPRIVDTLVQRFANSIPASAQLIARQTVRVVRRIVVLLVIESLVVVVLWFIIDHDAMGKVFDMTNMPIGSRIVTTLLSFMWLPNLCIWALSWLFGAGFSIGTLGSFTLWSGSAHDLPPVPLFGIFPQAVATDWARFLFLLIPIITGFLVGFFDLASRHGFNYFNLSLPAAVTKRLPLGKREKTLSGKDSSSEPREQRSRRAAAGEPADLEGGVTSPDVEQKQTLVRLVITKAAYPLVTFCATGIVLVFIAAVAFVLSNGALGTGNLAHVGVDVAASTQAVARPVFSGLLIAWVVALVCFCIVNVIRFRKRSTPDTVRLSDDDLVPLAEINKSENAGEDAQDVAGK
jgi:hypothetical protein